MELHSLIFKIPQDYTVIFFQNHKQKKKLVKSVNFLFASIKSMNPMQKYPQVIELLACTLKILAFMFLFPTNYLISPGTFSTPKLSK